MPNDITRLLQSHRSIRKYTEDSIPDNILKNILSCAQWAPSSHNVQAYSVIIVRNTKVKEQLSEICKSQKWVIECPIFLVFCADYYRLKLTTDMYSTNFEIDEVENLLVGAVDTALAAENVLIAARSYGLGGVFMGGIRNDLDTVIKLLNIPKYVVPLFGMCLGYPADIPWQKPRLPGGAVIHNETYKIDQLLFELEGYEQISADYYNRRTNGRKTIGWTKQMAKYVSEPRNQKLKKSIIKQGIQLK
ncbi:oxygen-insensitive NADPH nitroreductase [Cytobacillus sp. FJAT-53684]|uniref:Oxygen-insensitive NADPH nitroreductase n=1 Tax=Cytobacillus mangrovibacter TaxID=3299024 RepID=A0ABW6K2M0_9BACI